jgi:glutathione peroxidase
MTRLGSIPLQDIRGAQTTLAAYRGLVILVVNVASRCGLTPQYEALESLYRRHQARGFVVLGFPANDFLAQEPGTDSEILQFCQSRYDVTFPMFKKLSVKGANQHLLYRELTHLMPKAKTRSGVAAQLKGLSFQLLGGGLLKRATNPVDDVSWNFEKFLIDRSGEVIDRFAPTVEPNDSILQAAIERALQALPPKS